MKRLFVTGIGTDVGKTVISAILTQKLQADYWKPIQAGELDNTDSIKVSQWVENSKSVIHPEAYRLTESISPHAAAERDDVNIEMNNIIITAIGHAALRCVSGTQTQFKSSRLGRNSTFAWYHAVARYRYPAPGTVILGVDWRPPFSCRG